MSYRLLSISSDVNDMALFRSVSATDCLMNANIEFYKKKRRIVRRRSSCIVEVYILLMSMPRKLFHVSSLTKPFEIKNDIYNSNHL